MLLDPKRWCRSKRNPENFEAHLADCKAGAGRHKGTAYVGDASKQASSQAGEQASKHAGKRAGEQASKRASRRASKQAGKQTRYP